MTVSTTTSLVSYTGNGATVAYPVPFRFLDDADLRVSVDGTLLEITTDYSVEGARDESGGTVTMVSAPVNGANVLIERSMDMVQPVDLITGGAFRAQTHEDALDRLTMLVQQVDFGHSQLLQYLQGLPQGYTNADLVNYYPGGIGAVYRTVEDKLRETVSVEDFGAVGDGVTDDYTAIQAAIAAVSTAGGGSVLFAAKKYAISSKLLIQTDGIRLIGKGSGSSRAGLVDEDSSATMLSWIGATATGPMVEFSSAGTYQLVGAGIIGIGLNCDNAKATGLRMTACFKCVVDDVTVYTSTGDAVQFDVQTLVSDPGSNQSLWVNRLSVVNNEAGTGDGVVLMGTTSANTNLSLFGELDLLMYDGDGLVLDNADGNVFQQIHCYRHPSGTGVGVRFKAGATAAEVARYNTIMWAQCASGGLVAEGTPSGTVASNHNRVLCYSFGNATPIPIIEAGASFSYGSDIGLARMERNGGVPTLTLARTDGNAVSEVISKVEAEGYNAAGDATIYGSWDYIINDATGGSEDASWRIAAMVGGALTVVGQLGNGWVVGNPTGGLQGNGTINAATAYYVDGNKVLGTRATGWGAPTGTQTRTAFNTATVTLPQLAERVKALIDDLTTHGVIGA